MEQTLEQSQDKVTDTRNQIALWTGLLEARMKFQNLLLAANKLPHPIQASNEIEPSLAKARKSVNKLLITLLKLREQYHSVSQLGQCDVTEEAEPEPMDDHFNTEVQIDSDDDEPIDNQYVGKVSINKIKLHSEPDMVRWNRRHRAVRMSLIEKWHEKTRLGTIPQKGKSYMALELSPVRLIENVLKDKYRLIKRTQLKRANYYIVGMSAEEQEKIDADNAYDCEIYDDEEFYQQLLKGLIDESSSVTRRQLPRAREKLKRKVDTKASKARKISMKVHPKLVNFMAPRMHGQSDIREELLKSLFGGGFITT